MGATVYNAAQKVIGPKLTDMAVERMRQATGGQLQTPPQTKIDWFMADLESAQFAADRGDLKLVGNLARSFRRDGTISGLLGTRTAGLIALPTRFYGRADIVAELQRTSTTRSVFAEMCPPEALIPFASDIITCGVAVAELCPVEGRDHPVMVHRSVADLVYRWFENQWYYRSTAGLLPVTPGDGRWVLYTGSALESWNTGAWHALGRAFITKEHAMLHRMNYSSRLANGAIVTESPSGATEEERVGFFEQLLGWGSSTLIDTPAGFKTSLLESNGRGWEVFAKEIETADREITLILAGSTVMVDGGSGFSNASIHAAIRSDLIKSTADALADTLNKQVFPTWVINRFGYDALEETARIEWDISPAADRKTEAESMSAVAKAVTEMRSALEELNADVELDVQAIINRFGIPTKKKTLTRYERTVEELEETKETNDPLN